MVPANLFFVVIDIYFRMNVGLSGLDLFDGDRVVCFIFGAMKNGYVSFFYGNLDYDCKLLFKIIYYSEM